ncbi:MAG TPA: hypothetical protein VIL86_11655 [Tepidisphaeraceae bacterium]
MKVWIGSFVLAAMLCGTVRADWTWELPPDRYKKLDQFERVQYDKAASLAKNANFKAAKSEFEKFTTQFDASDITPYMVFMRGFMMACYKERYGAIKCYQEVLDVFPDSIDAPVALYHMGMAHLENGDTFKGLQCMKTLVEDPRYQKHVLAAGALRRLADNHWKNKQFDQAVGYWRQVVRDFTGINNEEVANAQRNLAINAILFKNYQAYEEGLITDKNKEDANYRKSLMQITWDVAWAIYTNPNFERPKKVTDKELAEERLAYYNYMKSTKPWFEKANDLFGYYDRTLQMAAHFLNDPKEREAVVTEAIEFVKKGKDKATADNQYTRLIDILRQSRNPDRARYVAALMSDRTAASWKSYEITCDEGKWPEAVKQLEDLETSAPDQTWRARALSERARLFKDVLNQQEKAIALYTQMNNPPWNLWQIQDSYNRWGKKDKAIATLTEISSMFPDDAPRALWQKVVYYTELNDIKKASGQAARLLKMYPKAPETANAHLWGNEHHIDLGGGDIHMDD